MLHIDDISYRYESRAAWTLRHVSLRMEQGEMLLLAGRSGCGKSTLIKIISGLVSEDGHGTLEGRIVLDGQDITHWSPEQIGMLTGTVYQSPDDQLFAMTVEDETGFALENQGMDPEQIQREVKETLRRVGLAGYEKFSIHQLSGGQRQRLALASILITKPRLLILDEPVSQMNPQGVQSFMELLLDLNRKEHISILMIEHRVNELARYFSRLAVMKEGEILYDGPIEQAWAFLTDKQDLGLREPQTVKLGRALHLSALTSDPEKSVSMIRKECEIEKQAEHDVLCRTEGKPLIRAEAVRFRYPGVKEDTLKGLDFVLQEGQITALMGFNGAGKSTLLNLLGGLAEPTGGTLQLDGIPVRKALGQVGYLLQESDLMLLADTVAEELSWKNPAMTPEKVTSMLEQLQLLNYKEDFPLALSKGQRLRVVLGAMLAKEPRLLLLDEPTTGQDESSLTEITKLLLDFKARCGSVFICTHDIELASRIADRVMLLEQGRILADGPAAAVLNDRKLLLQSGLTVPAVLDISEELGIPPCISEKEVTCYVHAAAVGRNGCP